MIGKNNYLTVYFLSFIQLLLEGDTDPRILADEDTEQITRYLHRLDAEESSVPSDLAKQYIVLMYMSWIKDRQENVEKTLSMILERKETDGMTPIQRYYMPGEKQPCNKIGANRQAKKKVAGDPALKEYRSAYQRLNKRVELGYMEKEAFQAWAKEAKDRCTQCQNGDITFEEYKKWLDETSRRRKSVE